MRDNVTLPLGSIAVTDKTESDYALISGIFGKAGGKTRNFVGDGLYHPVIAGVSHNLSYGNRR
ncbi:MAG: hypothetical protein M1448_00065 [Candidatus Marsarchaeota archaeon]|nr:hypothetical protein [Candidatus Marsarchaeota archaeon]